MQKTLTYDKYEVTNTKSDNLNRKEVDTLIHNFQYYY